jgi:tRNA (adenine37-N6)-methyltransferase
MKDIEPCMRKEVSFVPIGEVRNSFDEPGDPKEMRNSESVLSIDSMYRGALQGIEMFRYVVVIFHFDRSEGYIEKVHPKGDPDIPMRGVLATRSPQRPNPIGLTLAEVKGISGSEILVTGLDALNGTPILDIKPYEEHFDSPAGIQKERDPGYRPGPG